MSADNFPVNTSGFRVHPSLSSAQLRSPGHSVKKKTPSDDFTVKDSMVKNRKDIKSECECTVIMGARVCG